MLTQNGSTNLNLRGSATTRPTKGVAIAPSLRRVVPAESNRQSSATELPFYTPQTPLVPAAKGIGFLIDMDGVIYRSTQVIEGAREFVHRLREDDVPFLFLTNNSSSTPRDYVVKLQKMGIEVEEHHFYTCAMATVDFLRLQKPRGTAFVIGEGGLISALHQAGYGITENHPDYVIVGEGRVLNFELVEKAMMAVVNGAHLIATNLDVSCPTAAGLRPGCGAIVSLLESATGKRAFSVGKPSPFMMRAARKRLGLMTDQTVMVGDTMETDIRGGVELGFHTILVLTGSTNRQTLQDYPYHPHHIVDSIAEIDLDELYREAAAREESNFGLANFE